MPFFYPEGIGTEEVSVEEVRSKGMGLRSSLPMPSRACFHF